METLKRPPDRVALLDRRPSPGSSVLRPAIAAGLSRLGATVRRLRGTPRVPRPPHTPGGGENPDEDEDDPGDDRGEGSAHGQRAKEEQDGPEYPDVAEPARKWFSPDGCKPVHGEAGGEDEEAENLDGAKSDDGLCDNDGGRLRDTSRRVRTREHIEGGRLADEHCRRDEDSYEPHEGRAVDQQPVLSVECTPQPDEVRNREDRGEPDEDVPGEERAPEGAELGEGCVGLGRSRRKVVGCGKRRDHEHAKEDSTNACQPRVRLSWIAPGRCLGHLVPARRGIFGRLLKRLQARPSAH